MLCCVCVWLCVMLWLCAAVVCVLCPGVDHSRQGTGQPQSELWDGVPSAGGPAPRPQGTVLGLRHRGKGIGPFTLSSTVHLCPYTSLMSMYVHCPCAAGSRFVH